MELNKKRKKVESWLQKNKQFINYTGMEKHLLAPKGLIQKYIKYDKKINDKHINEMHILINSITKFTIK